MEPMDKFGNPMYWRVYRQMISVGAALLNCGYTESRNKPNLFFRATEGMVFFADMRGTKSGSPWRYPVTLLYVKVTGSLPHWRIERSFHEEIRKLRTKGCDVRQSTIIEPKVIDARAVIGDGFCRICGKDFQADGLFCSPRCELESEKRKLLRLVDTFPPCPICKKRQIPQPVPEKIRALLGADAAKTLIADHSTCNLTMEKRELAIAISFAPTCENCQERIVSPYQKKRANILLGTTVASGVTFHHTSYANNEGVYVCSACHAKIHRSKEGTHHALYPVDRETPLFGVFLTTTDARGDHGGRCILKVPRCRLDRVLRTSTNAQLSISRPWKRFESQYKRKKYCRDRPWDPYAAARFDGDGFP